MSGCHNEKKKRQKKDLRRAACTMSSVLSDVQTLQACDLFHFDFSERNTHRHMQNKGWISHTQRELPVIKVKLDGEKEFGFLLRGSVHV